MRRVGKFSTIGLTGVTMAAFLWGCGTQSSNMTSKFLKVDSASKTVTLNLIAGYSTANNYENFNGYANGGMTITIPTGYTVQVKYYNNGGIPVDFGVYTKNDRLAFKDAGDSIFTMFENPAAGVIPGQSETVKFVASTAGTYQIANFVDRFEQLGDNANQDLGMWDTLKIVDGANPSITAS